MIEYLLFFVLVGLVADAAPLIFTSTTFVIFSPSDTILSARTSQAFHTASANNPRRQCN